MTEQWQELKETITEMRDNDGTGTQQEVCKFLVNLMDVLEKQMQEPCEDVISRQAVLDLAKKGVLVSNGNYESVCKAINELPSVNTTKTIQEKQAESGKYQKAFDDGYENGYAQARFDYEQEPYDFAKWVATEIFDEMWEYNKDAFEEIACRKLAKLGIVKAKGDEWELVEPQERSDKE